MIYRAVHNPLDARLGKCHVPSAPVLRPDRTIGRAFCILETEMKKKGTKKGGRGC